MGSLLRNIPSRPIAVTNGRSDGRSFNKGTGDIYDGGKPIPEESAALPHGRPTYYDITPRTQFRSVEGPPDVAWPRYNYPYESTPWGSPPSRRHYFPPVQWQDKSYGSHSPIVKEFGGRIIQNPILEPGSVDYRMRANGSNIGNEQQHVCFLINIWDLDCKYIKVILQMPNGSGSGTVC